MPASGESAVRPASVARWLRQPMWTVPVAVLLVLVAPGADAAAHLPGHAPSVAQQSIPSHARDQVGMARVPSQPASQAMLRGGARRGCWFAGRSAKLTRPCERKLRAAVKRMPRGIRVAVIGVSVDEATPAKNRWLAKRRARAVALYLRAIGVRGKLPRVTVITRGGGGLLGRAVVVGGSPQTTVVFGRRR